MLSKQTTNDYEGEVSEKFELENLVGLRTLDSEMSALLLVQSPPPSFSHSQFCSVSH